MYSESAAISAGIGNNSYSLIANVVNGIEGLKEWLSEVNIVQCWVGCLSHLEGASGIRVFCEEVSGVEFEMGATEFESHGRCVFAIASTCSLQKTPFCLILVAYEAWN